MVGRVDYGVLDTLAKKLVELSSRAKEMHVTSADGRQMSGFRLTPRGRALAVM